MSADNGIYILKTRAPNALPEGVVGGPASSPFEYRVVHAQAIENLYYDIETSQYNEQFTPEVAYSYFKECQPLYSEDQALRYAHQLEEQHYILEYGVCILEHGEEVFQTFTDEELSAHEAEGEALMEANRKQRDAKQAAQRAASVIPFGEGMVFLPNAIYGRLLQKDGSEVHGSLSGVTELGISQEVGCEGHLSAALNGEGMDLEFLPSDWNKD